MLQTYRETRRRFFDHPAVRIEGAAARAGRNCRTPQALTPELQIVLTLRGAFVYERGSSHSLLTANQALFIAPGDVSRDRFVDENPLDYMLVTPHLDAVSTLIGDAAATELKKLARDTRVSGASARVQHAASALWNLCQRTLRDDIEIEQSAIALLDANSLLSLFPSPAQRGRAGWGHAHTSSAPSRTSSARAASAGRSPASPRSSTYHRPISPICSVATKAYRSPAISAACA